ncbi:acetyl-CoA carboxylase biotin carboxylase subunit [Dysgonomonas macrotermitis]|uniref:biotin carboxylase n=1 Tax=Dysgonomonas macrotermitis TaxID=1346286 RepID=A0A1M5EKU5_9BACT|nr:biotin carboxylase N-terminal domain-containing protein [Dysgonomonas macrotermitis]SHF79898.1 acetyl-CoA carboxylase, biotin carboxylase subunit/propionyl-CoA carboxylase alpha chain [Dysgonomonas macrotermitis]
MKNKDKIKSILIANRGEIAIRIAQTARKMGITPVGIRTVKEPNAYYLTQVDKVVDFPDREKNDVPEFLDIESLVLLAKRNKIDAIHPGYGYLSENAQFAIRCTEEGIIFIGPSPRIIQNMGDKVIAKEIAAKGKVPMLGGSNGSVDTLDEAIQISKEIGFPLIIKAVAGGGGRGMRIVRKQSEIKQMYHSASTEALSAFNNPSVFIEKYLENPKHIEVQIVADTHGNVIHLWERECSVQRKHQKLLEEAPSPALDDKLRKKITDAAVSLAREAGYVSLGTVEFLLDKHGDFFFMEMNTRVQVEHPVTEMITGLDLIELQIRIANGEKLPITQEEVKLNGWAIECRINAEDVQSNFSPCTGMIKALRLPEGEGIRVDKGVVVGSEVTPFFDSMIAKLIVHAEDRNAVIKRTLEALNDFQIKGIKTTIPFDKAVLHNEIFCNGNFDTSFIEKDMESTVHVEKDEEIFAALFAVSQYGKQNKPITEQKEDIDLWALRNRINNM